MILMPSDRYVSPTSPAALALDGPWTHAYLHPHGLRLHAATAGDPNARLVVFLHDTFGSWADFRKFLAPLAESKAHVAALDARGYGLSDKPPHGYSLATAATDLSGAIRELGHGRAVVVGYGTGAAVGWALAAAEPQRVAGLLAINGVHPLDGTRAYRPYDPVARAALLASRLPTLWRPTPNTPHGTVPGAGAAVEDLSGVLRLATTHLHKSCTEDFTGTEAFQEEAALYRLAASIENAAPAIRRNARMPAARPPSSWTGRVSAPVWLLHDDASVPDSALDRARRRAPELRAFSLPGTKRAPHLEDPTAVLQLIREFLADLQ